MLIELGKDGDPPVRRQALIVILTGMREAKTEILWRKKETSMEVLADSEQMPGTNFPLKLFDAFGHELLSILGVKKKIFSKKIKKECIKAQSEYGNFIINVHSDDIRESMTIRLTRTD